FQPADATPLKTQMRNLSSYSPTTGTCEMSPFSSPMSHHAQQLRNHPSEAKQSTSESRVPRRGQPQAEKDEFLELQVKVNSSMDRILKIRENLQSLKALEGSRELEKIIRVSHVSTPLSAQLQKTQVLRKE
ncbi:CENPR protein, partial [Alcedo cyanopectus]|nr:CENPR protein [Ceyx cyanopectus]